MRLIRSSRQFAKIWPADAKRKIRDMRALGATWELIAIPFDCEWQVVRNFYLGDGGLKAPASAIRKWRVEAKLSLEEVCDRFKNLRFDRPSTAKLSRIETGQAVPLDMISQFVAITGLSAKEISPEVAKIFAAKEDAA